MSSIDLIKTKINSLMQEYRFLLDLQERQKAEFTLAHFATNISINHKLFQANFLSGEPDRIRALKTKRLITELYTEKTQNLNPLITVCSKASDTLAIIKESQDPKAIKLAVSALNSLDIEIRLTSLNIFTICQTLLEKQISQTIIDEIDNVTKLLNDLFSKYKSLLPPPEKRNSPLRALRKANNPKKQKEEEKETLNLNRRSLIIKKESAGNLTNELTTDKDGTMEIKPEKAEEESIVLKIKTLTISYEKNFQQAYLLPKDNLIRLAMADIYKKCKEITDNKLKEEILADLSKHFDAIFSASNKEGAIENLINYTNDKIKANEPNLAAAFFSFVGLLSLIGLITMTPLIAWVLLPGAMATVIGVLAAVALSASCSAGIAACALGARSAHNFFTKRNIKNDLGKSVIKLADNIKNADNFTLDETTENLVDLSSPQSA